MKLHQLPARALPVTLRPMGGETVISWCRRLAEANGLTPTAVLRAAGQVTPGSGRHLLGQDAWLSDPAITRLEALSAMPRARLAAALPALRQEPPRPLPGPPPGSPAVRCYSLWPPARPACHPCTLRAAGSAGVTALVRPEASPLVCRRHQRWLGAPGETAQAGLAAAPEILTAHRRYQHLLAGSASPATAGASLAAAGRITARWAGEPRSHPLLSRRWHDRAARLGLPGQPVQPAVTFPETVTLALILADPAWRRHAAMACEWQLDRLYRHIARRLGEPACQAPSPGDPVITWTAVIRRQHAPVRDSLWSACLRTGKPVLFPDKDHFA